MTNKSRKTLYVGAKNDIERRVAEHKNGVIKGFTLRYKATECIVLEECGSVEDAIAREKQIKSWLREKKEKLVKSYNPKMLDLNKE